MVVSKKYIFLYHTADVKFRAYGKTVEQAFRNAALATFRVMSTSKIKSLIQKKIFVEAPDYQTLLCSFLEQLLFYLDTEDFFLSDATVLIETKKKGFSLTAIAFGDSAKKYETHTLVKAITYHEMLIQKKKDVWIVQVILDV